MFGHEIACAQTIDEIKQSGEFYWGEGEGVTIEEAQNAALEAMAKQISVNVTASTNISNRSNIANGELSSNTERERKVILESTARLHNYEQLELSQAPDAKVLVYVNKDEIRRIREAREQRINNYFQEGLAAEKNLQIDDALRLYYWALMLARQRQADGEPPATVSDNGSEHSAVSYIPIKIKSVLANLSCNVTDAREDAGRCYVNMNFNYSGRKVSTLQFKYHDGQSYIPMQAMNGEAELSLVKLPSDDKINIRYEYLFIDEGKSVGGELESAYANKRIRHDLIDSNCAVANVPVKVDIKKGIVKAASKKETTVELPPTPEVAAIKPDVKQEVQDLVPRKASSDNSVYLNALVKIEAAIKAGNPRGAYECFTTDGYKLFQLLFEKCGKISLVGTSQSYDFIEAEGQVLARFCKVNTKFRNGKSFRENIVFRFNPHSGKVESLAFGLTQIAEDDIFDSSRPLTDKTRNTMLRFMEDYQTAYALQRTDYIESIFSNNALIILGIDLKRAGKKGGVSTGAGDVMKIDFDNPNVRYDVYSKEQYIKKLKKDFSSREYMHFTFQDNDIYSLNPKGAIKKGAAVAIQINQIYNTPSYSDQGYLTLLLDTSNPLPIIYVRLWQPDKTDMMSIEQFISKLNF